MEDLERTERYRQRENYVHTSWTVEKRMGHIYRVLLEEVAPFGNVLCVGGNTGSTAGMIYDLFDPKGVVTIDINPAACEAASEVLGDRNVSVGCMDILSSYRPDIGTFDTLVLLDVIEHIEFDDEEDLVVECHSLLDPGGRVLITTPRWDPWKPSQGASDPHHVRMFERVEDVTVMWSMHGFEVVETRNETRANPGDGNTHDMWWVVLRKEEE